MSDKHAVPESLVWYRESVTWLTALASGALAAGAALYQRTETFRESEALQWVLLIGGAVFVFVIVSGVICYSYLTQFANAADTLAFYREAVQQSDSRARGELKAKLDSERTKFEASQRSCQPWYVSQLYGYGLGMLLFALAAVLFIRAEAQRPAPTPGAYAFTTSSAGTLILDTRTGQTWRVIETKDGLQLQAATPAITTTPAITPR
jgi:uncharacterized membrane protein